MRFLRPASVIVLGLLIASGAGAATRSQTAALKAPQRVHGFLLRADDPSQDTFTRTPSFAWNPVAGAARYEFQLATARTFASGALLARKKTTAPVASLAISLPWVTGTPYSLYARARALAPDGSASPWSELFGFNVRWSSLPTPLTTTPGLVRWTPVDGATSYEVWFLEPHAVFRTQTNVADEREYYTFHQDAKWTGAVHWRVRAVRALFGVDAATDTNSRTGLPETSYGPWSPIYTATNPTFASGVITPLTALSDGVSTKAKPGLVHYMPGFSYTGDSSSGGDTAPLYRVYVATDRDCVNIVFRGAAVGSPAYAPRWFKAFKLPTTAGESNAALTSYLGYAEPATPEAPFTRMIDDTLVLPNEQAAAPDPTAFPIKSGEDDSPGNDDTDGPPTVTPAGAAAAAAGAQLLLRPASLGPPVDLWDTDGLTGRYYWTVVPVGQFTRPSLSTTLALGAVLGSNSINVVGAANVAVGDELLVGVGNGQDIVTVTAVAGNIVSFGGGLQHSHFAGETVIRTAELFYRDLELPQDACTSGRVGTFGKTSDPALASTNNDAPFASGLSPKGTLVSANASKTSFYGTPVVAWKPALGASAYEVQWSKTRYPFVAAATPILTWGTSTTLPLTAGTWWYRVRGINLALPPGARAMAWSPVMRVVLAKPKFSVLPRR
jgi:hypothetical protein